MLSQPHTHCFLFSKHSFVPLLVAFLCFVVASRCLQARLHWVVVPYVFRCKYRGKNGLMQQMDPHTPHHHHFPARPRLAASPSPSRSPSRRYPFSNQGLDSVLADLSPSSTLEALQASDYVQGGGGNASKSFIQESVKAASASERAWGVKAALAGKKVQEWYAEIGQWPWPGFVQPHLEDSTDGRGQHHHDGHASRQLSSEAAQPNERDLVGKQTMGALSSKLVQEYEGRIETIRDEMETLEIDDLKNYVRYTHYKTDSRRPSLRELQASSGLATDYGHLDDFTAIITATIVQALPTISRLENLLSRWSTRLLVLRQVSSFLIDLDSGRESLVSASIAIDDHDAQHPKRRTDFSWKAFSDIRAVLQDQITELGRKLDGMLDLLEGSADTLPDAWIDGLDDMEHQYSAWVVKAERLAMDKELRSERLEKDFTQDHKEKRLYLDQPSDLRHTTSNLELGAPFNEIRRQADSGFGSAGQYVAENLKTEDAVSDPPTRSSVDSFDLNPFPSRGAVSPRVLSDEAQLRAAVAKLVEDQSLNGRIPTPPSRGRQSHRPASRMVAGSKDNVKTPNFSDTASEYSDSGSSTSNYSSNRSSPEIQSAVVAEFIGTPIRLTSPPVLSREPMTSAEIIFRRLGPPAGVEGADNDQSDVPSDLVSKNDWRNGGPRHVRTRSESFRSFEVTPKHEIRRIQVQRSGSHSSTFSLSDPEYGHVQPNRLPPSFNPQHGESDAFRTTRPLPAAKEGQNLQSSAPIRGMDLRLDIPKRKSQYHQPPPVSVQSSASVQSSEREFHTPKQQLPYHSPPAVPEGPAPPEQSLHRDPDTAEHRPPYHSPPPVPPKAAHRFEQVSDLGPGSTPVKIRQTNTNESKGGRPAGHVETPRTVASATKTFDDQLEERISSILTDLPTQIRLTSGPEPDAPEVTPFNSPSNPKGPKTRLPAWRFKKRQASTSLPSMTLAPAQPKSSQSRSPATEPDIKLYHLHQAGRSAPIKLFVRLVGDGGERVMVRIGGGWADLGEYLREYAGHHGRRSVSDSPFDITGLPSSSPLTNNPSLSSKPGSRPISPTSSSRQFPANRLARQQTSPALFTGPHTPQSGSATRVSSRLSWAGTDDVSPSLGLAGPKTKNVDISPRKQAWVDEMMEQARQGGCGGEKKGGSESVVGDLGKVGRTRRVFFRSKKVGGG